MPDDLLLIEHVLDRVAAPLARNGAVPPLVLVLDGMSAAVASQLAEQIRTFGLSEVGRQADGREGAVAVIPSVTGVSRTSLLCGRLATGGTTVRAPSLHGPDRRVRRRARVHRAGRAR
jgi:hypothetical protein